MRYLKLLPILVALIASETNASAQETNGHPALDITRAKQFFEAGDKEKAVYWYYVAQLRFRIHLTARPDLAADQDMAVFSSLSEVVGRPINEWAFGDLEQLLATLDEVIVWHNKNDDQYTPKAAFPEAHRSNIDGLKGLRDEIASNVETIRAQRTKAGLENR